MKHEKFGFFLKILIIHSLISINSCKTNSDIKTIPIIEISPHFSDNSFVFEDVFESVEVIPLETGPECLIGGITGLVEANYNYYILDGVNNIVAKFNSEGRFITRIGTNGNGPGEYLKVEDIIIDNKNQSVILYDIRGRKIIVYDLNGKYIREFRVNAFLKSIEPAENDNYWGYTGNISNSKEIHDNNQGKLKFIIFDKNGTIVNKIFGHKHSVIHLPFYEHISHQQDGSISFVEPLQNQIFKLTDDVIVPCYTIKFSNYSVPDNIWEQINQQRTPETANQKRIFSEANKNYILGFIQFHENNDWIILQYSIKYKFQFALYHKPTGQIFESSGLPMSIVNANMFFTPLHIDEKYVYASSSAIYLHERFKEELKNKKIGEERFRYWHKLLDSIEINDNPVIYKYKLNSYETN